jgi:hypothetical protein
MADVQIYVNMTQQPINVTIAESVPISVILADAVPINVVLTDAEPINLDITGQIKGDTGPAGGAALTSKLDTDHSPLLYAGEAQPGSDEAELVWRIWRVDVSIGSIKEWANGAATFVNKWTERLNLSYS